MFYTFDEIDRSKLDVGRIAQHIWDEDMGERKRTEYIDSLWESGDDNMLRLFFGRKLYFLRQLNIELMKLSHPDIYDDENNIKYGTRALEDMTLHEIGKINPALEKSLRDQAFEKAKDKYKTEKMMYKWLKEDTEIICKFSYLRTISVSDFSLTFNKREKNR